MRYLIVFLVGTVVIYIGFLMSFTGPAFALAAQPVYSAVLSAFALLAALLLGLPTRFAAVARFWHHTPLGVSIALLAISRVDRHYLRLYRHSARYRWQCFARFVWRARDRFGYSSLAQTETA
jgi:hypothetical protein